MKVVKLHVLATGEKVETTLTEVWAHHEGGVLVGVVEVMLNERWGCDESVPVFADTLEALQGFHGKTLQNVDDDIIMEEGCVVIVRHFCLLLGVCSSKEVKRVLCF